MEREDFKKMMSQRFSLNGKVVNVVLDRPDYVQMEADISISGIPMSLIDDLHWRKNEIDFAKSLENKQVRLLAQYHRTSRKLSFDQRNFYYLITGKDGEEYPNYIVIYNKEGEVTIVDEKDPLFPKNEKQELAIDVLEEELRILKALNKYYADKFKLTK